MTPEQKKKEISKQLEILEKALETKSNGSFGRSSDALDVEYPNFEEWVISSNRFEFIGNLGTGTLEWLDDLSFNLSYEEISLIRVIRGEISEYKQHGLDDKTSDDDLHEYAKKVFAGLRNRFI